MKTKTEVAKVLLKEGWSWDEVRGVLERDKGTPDYYIPYIPFPVYYPYQPNYYPQPTITICDTPTYYLDSSSVIYEDSYVTNT